LRLDQTTLLRLGQALIRHKGFLGFGPKGKEELIFLGAYVRLNDLLKIVTFDQANASGVVLAAHDCGVIAG